MGASVLALDPRHLQILLDVARTGSFSAAAKLRNVSQPAISVAVSQLERRDGFEVVVAPDHPLMEADVELRELSKEPWVLPSVGGPYRRQVDALFFASQVQIPSNLVRCDSLATTKEIVRLSRYMTVFPRKV